MNTLRLSAYLLPLAVCGLLPAAATQPAKVASNGQAITNSLGMKLALIPAGKFLMGSPAGEAERDPEELQHEVVITRPFYMGVHEVTQGQYEKLMGKNLSFFGPKNGGTPEYPVEQVRWAEAVEFCKRLSNLAAEKKAGRTMS